MNASDPSTPPDILASLARSKKASVRRAVAENPNTPVEILNGLWESLPASLLANPILAFWELTEPGALLEHISERVLLATYNHLRKTGEDLPPLIYTHESLKHVMECALDRCDTRVFDHAPHDPTANLRLIFLAASMRYSRSRFFYEKAPAAAWRALASDPHPEVRLRFAELLRAASSSVETPSAEFTEAARALAESGGEDVFLQLAHCPAIPADVARRLASSKSMEIRRTLAHCVNMPADSIELLCKEPDESVRLAFAKKSRLNQAHELLLRDASHKVRESLAANFRVRRQILSQFDMKDHPAVLKNVFLNSHAGDQLRHRIFMEAHPDVKEVIAHRGFRLTPGFYFAHKGDIPPTVLAKLTARTGLHCQIAADLATDPDPKIRISIAHRLRGQYGWRDSAANLALLERFCTDPDEDIRKWVCTDSRLTFQQTEALARDTAPIVREKVLSHALACLENCRNCKNRLTYEIHYRETRSLFVEAANDTSVSVRSMLAGARETPPEALGILFDDPDADVRETARDHTIWPFGAVLDFEFSHPRFKGPTRHGSTTPSHKVLSHFARGKNPFLRKLTAECSRTGLGELRLLAGDSHAAVREAAQASLNKRNKPTIAAK